ncbi:serine/arginine repetitive matrix protein 1-like [Penaeus indicus]|uniref:serine/arginine repetitive matrix protein 1-like n=1 Tax=Penaeus indicus TaxID=29960 RepID=UPI00300C353C
MEASSCLIYINFIEAAARKHVTQTLTPCDGDAPARGSLPRLFARGHPSRCDVIAYPLRHRCIILFSLEERPIASRERMPSSPRPASEPLMINASSTPATNQLRRQDSARASRPTAPRHGGPRAEPVRDDSSVASAAGDGAREASFPFQKSSEAPGRHRGSGQLKRGRVASCPPSFRSCSAAAAIKATALLSLQITGLRVRSRDSWRRFPKKDSENRARRYLVEVDEWLGTRPRQAEDPQVRPLKRSNPINDARPARAPVADQRDLRPLALDRQIRRSDIASRGPGGAALQPRPASASRLPARERREARPLLRSKSTRGTRSKRRKKDSSGEPATPSRRLQRGSPAAPAAPPAAHAARERSRSDDPAALTPREPKALLRVTVRTTPAAEQPRHRSDGAARTPASGEQQERRGTPGRCAHVSGVRRESPPPSPSSPPRATCRPSSPRSLQSLAGRSLGQRQSIPHAPRPAYIAPRSPLARQSLQQHLQGYTCFSSPEGISLLIQRCPTAPTDDPPASCCDVPASSSHRLLQNIACQVSHLSAAGKLPL